jgi:hypothetical protein
LQFEGFLDRDANHVDAVGHRRVGDLAARHVDAEAQAGVAPDRAGDPVVGEGQRMLATQ